MNTPTRRSRRITTSLAALAVALGLGTMGAPPASAAPRDIPVPMDAFGDAMRDTGQFVVCLGGFGFAAAPVVAGAMFGGPAGAAKAAKEWFPKLGPAGDQTMKSCMWSIFHIKV
ncbi:hypothetical protein [Mycolicibacterium gilvum]|uniref:hypothetical protein n=1 Tax=Mycolicibacterium gilvum TaxID=1804 RepID=UPI0040465FF3